MTDRELAQLESLLTRFRDAVVWDRREPSFNKPPQEEAISRTIGTVRRARSQAPLYRNRPALTLKGVGV